MQSTLHKPNQLKYNYLVNILDGSFFGFGLGFTSFTTILPLFIATMTDVNLLIGLVPAIHSLGWHLPQLLTASQTSRMPRFKPWVLILGFQERLPILGFMIAALLIPIVGKSWALGIAFFFLIWQGLGGGFAANPWQNMIAKIIPNDFRATFFGLQSGAANLLAGVGAILAGIFLEKYIYPYNFAICFLLASLLMFISFLFLSLTKEDIREIPVQDKNQIPLWKQVKHYLRENSPFRWFLISRILFQFAAMASAFYIVYAVKIRGVSPVDAGIMTSIYLVVQVVSNPLFGWIADRFGRSLALETGAIATCIAAGLAWFSPSVEWFYPVMIFAGIANTVFWTIGIAASMDFGTENERPMYVGMANTLIAPSAILAPMLGGWLADSFGYITTFITAIIFGIITWFVLRFFVRKPRKK